MTGIIVRWFVNALAIFLITEVLAGVHVEGYMAALVAAAALGVVNAVLRPVLLVLSMPLNLLTLGLFTFVINALLFWLVAAVVDGLAVTGFLQALIAAILISIVSSLLSGILGVKK